MIHFLSKDHDSTQQPKIMEKSGAVKKSFLNALIELIPLATPLPLLHRQAEWYTHRVCHFRSKRSRFITLVQAATKSLRNFS